MKHTVGILHHGCQLLNNFWTIDQWHYMQTNRQAFYQLVGLSNYALNLMSLPKKSTDQVCTQEPCGTSDDILGHSILPKTTIRMNNCTDKDTNVYCAVVQYQTIIAYA
jgi:hypothetical protein